MLLCYKLPRQAHQGGAWSKITEAYETRKVHRVGTAAIKNRVEHVLANFPKASYPRWFYSPVQPYSIPMYAQLPNSAERETPGLNDELISVEHLLIAIASKDTGHAAGILKEFGVDKERIYQTLPDIRDGHRVDSPTAESRYRSLEKYGCDPTELARQGKLDLVIGHDDEIKRVMQVLDSAVSGI